MYTYMILISGERQALFKYHDWLLNNLNFFNLTFLIFCRNLCLSVNSSMADNFPDDNNTVSANIYKAGIYLGCQFGPGAMYIWAVGVLAAGQASTMTGDFYVLIKR